MTDDERWEKEAAPLFAEARAKGETEVPPAALARAKAGVKERLGRGPALFPFLALAGAVAVVAVAVVLWKRPDAQPGVFVADGNLHGDSGRRFEAGDRLDEREVFTGATSASLQLRPGALAQLMPGTSVRGVSPEAFSLIDGRVKLSVTTGPFKVRARAVTLEVVGTVFEVACFGDEVQLRVSEGVVRAVRDGQTWEVKAGETWPAPEVPAPPAPMPSPELRAVHQTRLEMAQALTRQGRLDAARSVYSELAKEDAPIAELALYHLAHLEAVRAHRPKPALDALDEQLRRFPNGALAPEAKLSRIEALRALGLDGGA